MANGFGEGPVDVVYLERDVLDKVAVSGNGAAHRMVGPDRCAKE